MMGYDLDRGGSKYSENASNSFIPKINRTVFWDLGTVMAVPKPMQTEFDIHRRLESCVIHST